MTHSKPRSLSFPLVALLVACGGSAPEVQRCAKTACAKGTRCDLATELCVQDVGPTVNLVPVFGVVTTPTVQVKGSVSDDTAVKLVQVQRGAEWSEVPFADGRFSVSADVGLHDSETASVVVRAFDSLDQQGSATLELMVDDVGPAIEAFSTADGGLSGATLALAGRVHDRSGPVVSFTAALPGGEPKPVAIADDGTFSLSLDAPSGLDSAGYVVTFEATDVHANASTLALPLLVDSVAPTGTIDGPAENTVVCDSIVVRGTVQDTAGVGAVRVRGAAGWVDATVSGSSWSAPTSLPPGDNVPTTIEVELVDTAGNVATLTRHVVVDTVAPAISFDAPGPNTTLSAPVSPVVLTAADGPGTVESVQVRLNGVALYATGGSSTSWAANLPIPHEDHVQETLEAIATDRAGNSTIVTRRVWIDNVPPVLAITSPAAGALLKASDFANTNDVVVTFTVSDGDPLVNVTVDGAPAGFGSLAALVPTSPTDNGVTKTVTVVATDPSGNSATRQISFTVDRVVPQVVIQSPVAGALLGGPKVVDGTATIAAHDGLKNVAALSMTFDGASIVTSPGSSPGLFTATFPLPYVDYVSKTIRVTASDAAGNVGSASVAVVVDRIAPRIVVTSPAANARLNASYFQWTDRVPVSWTVTDADPAAGTIWFNNGAAGNSVRTGTVTTSLSDNPKSYSPRIDACDSAGNASTVFATFSVDRVLPTVVDHNVGARDTNVEPRVAWYTFSEPVMEDVPFTFTTSRGPVRPGSWNASHTTFTSGFFDPDAVVSTTIQSIHDASGNPLVLAGSKVGDVSFHVAVTAPNGTLATGVASYDIASDANGVPTVAVRYAGGDVEAFTFSPATGLREPTPVLARTARPYLQELRAVASLKLGADATTPTRISGVTTYSCVPPACATALEQDRKLFVGGVEVPGLSTTGVTPVALEIPDTRWALPDGTGDYGLIDNALFQRGSTQLSLGVQALGSVSAPKRWAAFTYGPNGVKFTHVDQLLSISTPAINVVTQTVTTTASPANVTFALDQLSNCLSVAVGSALFEYPAGHTCVSAGCPLVAPVNTMNVGPELRVAPFSSSTAERGLLVLTHDANGTMLRKQKATPTCDAPMVDVTVPALTLAGTDFRPVQLGNKPAIAYLDPSANLKVYVP